MQKYRGILLDADNTLFDYDRAEAEALAETLAETAPGVPRAWAAELYREINAAYWKRFEAGEVDAAGLQSGRWTDLYATMGIAADPARAAEAYVSRLSCKAFLLPDAAEVVEELSRSARLCLVTNGLSRVQRGRLTRSGLAGFFSAVLISEELGVAKPDARFFSAAASALGMAPEDLLCIGDNPRADIAGARAAGIDACWISPRGAPWPGPGDPPRHIVSELREVLQVAGGGS